MFPTTIVVIPCYNEARRLQADEFLDFTRQFADVRLLMVDDGSNDNTLMRLYELSAQSADRIRIHHLPQNQGKAEAVRQGVLAALADRPRYVGYWDADLATPLDEIPRFRQILVDHGEVQMVLGTRLPLLGRDINRSLWRGWMGRLFARAASVALSLRIVDTQCGAKMLRVTDMIAGMFAEPFLARWIFDVELIARLRQACPDQSPRQMLYEYPLNRWGDVAGSCLKLRDFAKAPVELAAIYWKYCRPLASSSVPSIQTPTSVDTQRAA